MKTANKLINVVGFLMGCVFLLAGGTDIQLGFGCILVIQSMNNLFK